MRLARLALLSLVSLFALSCAVEPDVSGSGDGEESGELVERPLVELAELDAWAVVKTSDDPLVGHRPEAIDCPLGAWRDELDQLEVQTGVCNYFALAQPSLVDLAPGDWVIVDLWHDTLDTATPATGHVAVLLGDALIGEAEVAIPGKAAVHRFEWTAEQPVPAGTPVHLHLHNHGYNAWTFVAIDARLHD